MRSRLKFISFFLLLLSALLPCAWAQTSCSDGSGDLDTAPPKELSPQEIIQKFLQGENRVKEARSHYSFTQDLMVQTLDEKGPDGQFHQVTSVSFDDKGKRIDNVTYSEQSTLRGITMSADDMDDVHQFMQWILTSDEAAQYNLTYAGQQHVDDLDTYVFHVVPKKEEKKRRYFEGRVWVDNRDLQVVKLCGKSVAEAPHKKNQPLDIRPTFEGYRQIVDGNWFPVFARVDDTLHFGAQSVHVREIVKFTGYKRTGATSAASKP